MWVVPPIHVLLVYHILKLPSLTSLARSSEAPPMIRILIVHDNSILSAGLRMMLSAALDLRVVGEADDDTAATMTARLEPHVALIDADSCRAGGLAAVRAIHAHCPHVGLVLLGLHNDPESRAEANGAGADSFVSKEEPATMLEEIRNLGRLLC